MRASVVLLTILALFSISLSVRADEFVAPELTGPVVDQMGVLGSGDAEPVSKLLRFLNTTGKAQFTVLVTSSLQGLSIEEYGIKLADAWKLGTKKEDKGLILIVAPSERRMRFEVGYGLEGEIPDVVAKRILDDVMRPYFKDGNMKVGIVAGVIEVAKILGMTTEEIRAQTGAVDQPTSRRERRSSKNGIWQFVILAFVLGIRFLLPILLGGGAAFVGFKIFGILGGFGGGILGLIAGAMLSSRFPALSLNSGRRSSWIGGGGGGFGGFGGGGGGSWGGGGGGFGGGGSSSSW